MDSVLSIISTERENLKLKAEMKKVSASLRDTLLDALKSGGTYSSFVPFFEAFDEWASDKQPMVQKRMIVDVVRAAYQDMLEFLNMNSEELRLYELAMQIYDGYVEYRIERDDRLQSYVFHATTVTVLATALLTLYANQKLQWLLKRAGRSGAVNFKVLASRFGIGGIGDTDDRLRETMLQVVKRENGFEKKILFMHRRLASISSEQRTSIAQWFIQKMHETTLAFKSTYEELKELDKGVMSIASLETAIAMMTGNGYIDKQKQPFLQKMKQLSDDMQQYRGAVTLCNVKSPRDALTDFLEYNLNNKTWTGMWSTDWISQLQALIDNDPIFKIKLTENYKQNTGEMGVYMIRDRDMFITNETAKKNKIGVSDDLMHLVINLDKKTYRLTSTQAVDFIVSVLSGSPHEELKLDENVKRLLWEYLVNNEAMNFDVTTFDRNAFLLYRSIVQKDPVQLESHKNDVAAQMWLSAKIVKSSEEWINQASSSLDKKTRENLEWARSLNQTQA